MNQDAAERQLWNAVERSHDLNPEGNIPVTMHATTVGLPPADFKVKEKGKEEARAVLLIDPNGNLAQIKEEPRFFPTKEGEVGQRIKFDPEKEIERRNKEVWLQQLNNLNFYARRGEEAIDAAERQSKAAGINFIEMDKKDWEAIRKREEMPELREIERALAHGSIFLRDAYVNLKKNYDLIYKNATLEEKERLNKYAEEISPFVEDFENIEQNPKQITKFSDMIEKGVNVLGTVKPKLLTPLRDFAIDKSSETVANLALQSYKKFGNTAPIINIENHPAGMSILTRAQDMREVVEKAREDFVKKAKEKGMSGGEAKKAAEKLIGATWDVGHINQLRRYGYDKSDIIKESEIIAPYVKHVHLSDNFGYENTELPMGMGNVPIKEILEKLKKAGFKGKKVIEAAAWWQHFSPGGKQNPPLIPTLQAMSSPIYPMQMQPAWDQVYGTRGGYFAGYGTINPEIHHSLYGAGFASLPTELGGTIPGKESRQTGTPMS